MIAAKLLEQIPLFADMSHEDLERVAQHTEELVCEKGNYLFREGDKANDLYVLLSGLAQMTARGPEGQQTVIEIIYPGDSFILAAVISGKRFLMSAEVVKRSQVLKIPGTALTELIRNGGDFGLSMLATLSTQYRSMVRQVKNQRLRTTAQRVAAFLLDLAYDQGRGENRITLPHSKKMLAALLGMSQEGLSRTFTALREQGVVIDHKQVQIESIIKLRRFCGFSNKLDASDRISMKE
ncbi:cyclic nucleotide-binding domain-containing protein [Sedimenticola hydrogenitrophicus]|uniref:cyclic nucleotide-binding domain-containing protein n=1 Tax=Sedimenticola hydrogenitrophicus TaxID=2967975 RepID=UPI0023AFCBAF|nr:cyclic nucleotide-binding domain-containing protein [Sedimenticola hydrogenitrophicus]